MWRSFLFLRDNQFLKISTPRGTLVSDDQKLAFVRVPTRFKSGGGMRPKKKIYHRVHELDRVMELQKKPSLILQLKSIIQSQKSGVLLLRDLEKHVGFVQKWNFMAVIEKYPSVFYAGGGTNRAPPFVRLTEKAQKIAGEETEARNLMEPIVVKNLRKLLMLSVDCRIPLEKIEFIQSNLCLPDDFKNTLIPKYPQFFSVKDFNGQLYLQLDNWDSSIAVTARENRLADEGILASPPHQKRVKISKDGNFSGQFAFKMCYPAGFRPNMSFLEHLEKWQKMEFPSPYLNARKVEVDNPKARKRVVGVLHELLSLSMEKRMTFEQLDSFHSELKLPHKLLLCLVKHQGIFYITNKGARGTVFLKEGYSGSCLTHKSPLQLFFDKFVSLTGRTDQIFCNSDSPSSHFRT